MRGYFGEWWDVPATENLPSMETPLGTPCIDCQEPVQQGDRGYIMPCVFSEERVEYLPMHRECQFLHTSGHTFGYCNCTDYRGLSRREAALRLWEEIGG